MIFHLFVLSFCYFCFSRKMSECHHCVELTEENVELKQEIEKLKRHIAEIESSAKAAYDPEYKFVDLSQPFEDSHVGQANEHEVEAELIAQLPKFESLFLDGKKFYKFYKFLVFFLFR